jgi:hypothetical protein
MLGICFDFYKFRFCSHVIHNLPKTIFLEICLFFEFEKEKKFQLIKNMTKRRSIDVIPKIN